MGKIRHAMIFLFVSGAFLALSPAASAEDRLPDGVSFKNGKYISEKDQAQMAFIPEGAFVMGSRSGNDNEKPAHAVWLSDFYMDISEVNNARFEKFVKESGYRPQGPWRRGYAPGQGDYPVRFVTWHDANAYADWAGKRLPTEAEWEKAARGEKSLVYPWGDDWNPRFVENPQNDFSPVKTDAFPERAAPYGCLGMGGNVWEWVADWYDRFYYREFEDGSVAENPAGPEDGAPPLKRFMDAGAGAGNERSTLKVIRGGGSWGRFAKENARTSKRMWANPSYWLNDTGFRCAVSAPRK
ncbi:conserved exported hypothetical protein, Sulfatase-modifying factor-like [Candidatus Desulfarcum epimagneticum]|uniref:Sulfatase-modifying factor enzyme-like domain-containing protein n=1 Tax=uncultured Desulfobacteraceae bacterium TaxID=218296 RepID=A0A484HH92_9BACT|nr:conserved exported hypothetical protein, Sulfatase-modifying factor-like [uncultured Desulfobacteraceae bacterium]